MGDRQTDERELDAHPKANPKRATQPTLKTLLLSTHPRTETLTPPRRRLTRRPPLHLA